MKKLIAVSVVSLLATAASAANPVLPPDPNDIYLGEPGYAGTGCPEGSVTAVLSQDAKTLSVLFSQYFTQTQGATKFGRSNCSVAVPVHVPPGFSVSLVQVDYRGFADIPAGASGNFLVEYFFAGQRGPIRTQNFPANYSDEFVITDKLALSAIVWSPCGDDVILRSNSAIRVSKRYASGGDAFMQVDSADFDAGIQYQLQWQQCTP